MKIRVHMFFYTLKSMNDGIEIILVWCHLVVKMSEALFQTDTPSKKVLNLINLIQNMPETIN